jgi:hypothetical protein
VPQNKQRRLHPLSWPMLCFVAAHLNSRWLHGIWLMLICTVLFIYNTLINKVIHSWGASQSWEEETKDCHDVEQWQNSHCSSLSSIASLKKVGNDSKTQCLNHEAKTTYASNLQLYGERAHQTWENVGIG